MLLTAADGTGSRAPIASVRGSSLPRGCNDAAVQPAPWDQLKRAQLMTRTLRRSAWWRSFRAELTARGIDPGTVTLVDSFDDDENIDVGLLQTEDRQLIAWRRRYSDEDPSTDQILEWHDVTDTWHSTPWRSTAAAFLEAQRHVRSQ